MLSKNFLFALAYIAGIAFGANKPTNPVSEPVKSASTSVVVHDSSTNPSPSVTTASESQPIVASQTDSSTQNSIQDSSVSPTTLQSPVTQDSIKTQTQPPTDSVAVQTQAEVLETVQPQATSPISTPNPPQKAATPEPSLKTAVGSPGKEPVIENPWEFVLVTAAFLSVVLVIMFTGDK